VSFGGSPPSYDWGRDFPKVPEAPMPMRKDAKEALANRRMELQGRRGIRATIATSPQGLNAFQNDQTRMINPGIMAAY
jgi:hypothetical protein